MTAYAPKALFDIALTTQPGAAPTWTDLSSRVIAWQVKRGRQQQLDRMETGVLNIVLRNNDRALDQSNSAAGAPYWDAASGTSNVKAMRRVRFRLQYPVAGGTVYDQFYGYLENPGRTRGGWNDLRAVITAFDGLGLLATTPVPLSPWYVALSSLNPDHWWRLSDANSELRDSGSRLASGTWRDGAGLLTAHTASASLILGETDGSHTGLNGGATPTIHGELPPAASITDTTYTIGCVVRGPFAPANKYRIIYSGKTAMLTTGYLWDNTSGTPRYNFFGSGTPNFYGDDFTASTLVIVVVTPAGMTSYVNGALASTGSAATSDDFSGIENAPWLMASGGQFDAGYPLAGLSGGQVDDLFVIRGTALSGGQVATLYGAYNYTEEATGARLGRLFDAMGGIPAGDRLIDPGDSRVVTDPWDGNTKDYVDQRIAAPEFGRFLHDKSGRYRFVARSTDQKPPATTVVAVFGDQSHLSGSTELPYESLEFDYSVQSIINEMTVNLDSGQDQTFADPASKAEFLLRRSEYDAGPLASSAVARDIAVYVVGRRKVPGQRITGMVVRGESAACMAALLALEMGDRIEVRYQEAGGGPRTIKTCVVQGYTMQQTEDRKFGANIRLEEADTRTFLVLDNATLGLLDSNRLGF